LRGGRHACYARARAVTEAISLGVHPSYIFLNVLFSFARWYRGVDDVGAFALFAFLPLPGLLRA
jgi:hypothetical protein